MGLYDSIVITGAGGMLGHALAELLQARGYQPTLLTRLQCNLVNETDIFRIFDHRPTLLLNCAAYTKVDDCEKQPELANQVNGYAVGTMARWATQHKTKLVHISTDFVFDGKAIEPYQIDDLPNPLSVYGRSKLLGETELQSNGGDDWLLVRTAWVYGRHGANFPQTMVTAARAGKPLSVVNDQTGSPTYASDLAAGILSLLDNQARGIFHFTNSGETTWYEFAKAALKEFDLDNLITPVSSERWESMRPGAAIRPKYSVLDLQPFIQTTNQTPRPWKIALADFASGVKTAGEF